MLNLHTEVWNNVASINKQKCLIWNETQQIQRIMRVLETIVLVYERYRY